MEEIEIKDKDYTFTGYNKRLRENAKDLRKNMTPQERKLWYRYLKNYGIKFYRQRSISRYIADFYCRKAKLVIELDGSQHYTPDGIEYDTLRTEIINMYGIKVLRFSNFDIDCNFNAVCKQIDEIVRERID
ncbi:MAG: endonuclease domain-containing protein [Clostridia bacterium]|nr:endonuclease domain-containing protein [Clostridia bacterium]